MKKVLNLIFIFVIFCLFTTSVYAAEPLSFNGGTHTVDLDTIGNLEVSGCMGAIYANNGANVTITGGSTVHGFLCTGENVGDCDGGCHSAMAVWADGATITIKGGTYKNDEDPDDPTHSDLIYVKNGGKIIIEGGTFECKTPQWTLNCKDSDGSTYEIKGGKFLNYDPSKSATEPGQPEKTTNFVADGYKVVQNGEYYEVVEDTEAAFKKQLAEGGNIVLNSDIELTGLINVAKSVTIDLNGHTINRSGDNHQKAAFYVSNPDVVLTITGSGNVSAAGPAVWVNAGKAVLNGGTYNSTMSSTIYAQGTGSVEILNGTYNCAFYTDSCYVTNLEDGSRETASIVVKGGEFQNFDPANCGAEGAGTNFVEDGLATKLSGGYYIVVCGHEQMGVHDYTAPTYESEGNDPYYECDRCHKYFNDAEGNSEITDLSEVKLAKLVVVENGNAIVSEDAVEQEIRNAEGSTVVGIPLLSEGKTVTSVEIAVGSMNEIADANKGLTLTTSEVTVTLDAKAVGSIAEQADGTPTITLEVKKQEEKVLNTAQKDALKDKKVDLVITAKVLADGKEISDFKGGKVTVEVPFTLGEGLTANDYRFLYIDDNGKVTELEKKYIDGVFVVTLEHFSEYAITRDAKTSGQPSAGTNTNTGTGSGAPAAAPAATPEKDNTPKTGAISFIGIIAVVSVIGLAVLKRD